jgi:hypothetical protein
MLSLKNHPQHCTQMVKENINWVGYFVRGEWLYVWVGYCNSLLNRRRPIIIACVFLPDLGFYINHCIKCVFVVLGFMHV